ncbi:hypothetical protein [Streptomyces sp. CBG33]|uniref:hypothetical protein n=2 Tax=Streptomyces TaxID=1883 RepID=UPI001644592A|nr:hypothetical protein [Streptomyces sp. CBG33]
MGMFGSQTPTIAEQREALAASMMDVRDLFTPIIDTAEGMRADLVGRGWTESVAEHIASTWLASMMTKVVMG